MSIDIDALVKYCHGRANRMELNYVEFPPFATLWDTLVIAENFTTNYRDALRERYYNAYWYVLGDESIETAMRDKGFQVDPVSGAWKYEKLDNDGEFQYHDDLTFGRFDMQPEPVALHRAYEPANLAAFPEAMWQYDGKQHPLEYYQVVLWDSVMEAAIEAGDVALTDNILLWGYGIEGLPPTQDTYQARLQACLSALPSGQHKAANIEQLSLIQSKLNGKANRLGHIIRQFKRDHNRSRS